MNAMVNPHKNRPADDGQSPTDRKDDMKELPNESQSESLPDITQDTQAPSEMNESPNDPLPEPVKTKREFPVFAVFITLLIIATLLLPWIPEWFQNTGSKTVHAKRENLGKLITLNYIGSLGVNTQIETQSTTLLLRGAADIKRGAALERREGLLGIQVCEVGTDSCWELMSR